MNLTASLGNSAVLTTSEKCSGHFETGINGACFGELRRMPSCICFCLAWRLPTNSSALCAISYPSTCQVASSRGVRYPSAEGSSHFKWFQTVLYGPLLIYLILKSQKIISSELWSSLSSGLGFPPVSWAGDSLAVSCILNDSLAVLPNSAVENCFQHASFGVSFSVRLFPASWDAWSVILVASSVYRNLWWCSVNFRNSFISKSLWSFYRMLW